MVKIDEHIQKMEEIKRQADNSYGRKKLELMKCYHRLQKQLEVCNRYLGGNNG